MALSTSEVYFLARKEFHTGEEKGKRLFGRLNDFSGTPPTTKDLKALYDIKQNSLRTNVADRLVKEFAALGLSTSEIRYVDVTSPGQHKTAYSNYIDAKSGVIVCNENDKRDDKNATQDSLFPSEVLWQNRTMMANSRGSSPASLNAIARAIVTNKESQRVIWHAQKHSDCERELENGGASL
jgi:hypothetical protein